MHFLDNITCLPDDIFDLVLRQVNNGTDIHNFKNTSKIFRKYYNDYIKPIKCKFIQNKNMLLVSIIVILIDTQEYVRV